MSTTPPKTYQCIVCGFVYEESAGDPEHGIKAGTLWADVCNGPQSYPLFLLSLARPHRPDMTVAEAESLWVNAKGILSEPLFCLLLMTTFWVMDSGEGTRGRLGILALLMTAMALTRTAALPMIAVYAFWIVTRRGMAPAAKLRELGPVVAGVAAYGLWVLLRPAATEDNYARIALDHGSVFLGAKSPLAAIIASLLRQANSIAEGWIGEVDVAVFTDDDVVRRVQPFAFPLVGQHFPVTFLILPHHAPPFRFAGKHAALRVNRVAVGFARGSAEGFDSIAVDL